MAPRDIKYSVTGEGPPRETGPHAELDETIVGSEETEEPEEDLYPPGTRISRYVVLEKIGEGGMGVVLAAFDPELGRRIALKILLPRRRRKGGARVPAAARLMREAQAIARLSHPNVVAVYDVGRDGESVFVAMEYVEGQTLTKWVEAHQGPLEPLLEIFAKAGRGLAAAHQAGLVHRDFKPDNVLVSSDGRVRVLDFGLARADRGSMSMSVSMSASIDEDSALSGVPSLRDWSDSDVLASPLTRDDAVVGTPRYMAPEQHAGLATDGRSDQYSFCVALYQALFRQEPFPAKTLREIVTLKTEGRVAPPPRGVVVPQWLQDLVLKGLSPRPADRYASMDEVVERLIETPEVKRRRWIGYTIGAVVLGGAAAIALWPSPQQESPCQGSESQLADVYDDAVRERIHGAIATVPLPYAGRTAADVTTRLDGYAAAWTAMHRDACEASKVRGEQSDELMDRRMACLADRRTHLSELVGILVAADRAVVERATQAVAALPRVDDCADLERLVETVARPSDDKTRAAVDRVAEQLARAAALESAGKYPDALQLVRAALADAEGASYGPAKADALDRLGSLLERTGDYTAAETRLREALWLSIRSGHDRRAASAATDLVSVVGDRLARHDEGLLFGEHAAAILDRLGADGLERARLSNNVGNVLYRKGDVAGARREDEQALAIRERISGPSDPSLGVQLANLGNVLLAEDDYDAALERFRRAHHVTSEALGAEHPIVGIAVAGIGNVYSDMDQPEKAQAQFEEALTIMERGFGPEHPFVGITLINIAQALADQGKYELAESKAQRATQVILKAMGREHPDYASAMYTEGEIYRGLGRYADARAAHERALSLRQRVFGADDERTAESAFALARLRREEGQPAHAIDELRAVLALYEGADADDRTLGHVRFELAKALWDAGNELAMARAEAGRALELLRTTGAVGAGDRSEIEVWLAEHPLDGEAADDGQ